MPFAKPIFLFCLLSFSVFAEKTPLEKQLEITRSAYLIPGLSAAIYVDGQAIEHAVSGIRKVGSPELIDRSDKFHLGSNTKAMTATLVATFVEEGRLHWTSTIEDLLPFYSLHSDFKKVTIEMLLSHHSGISRDPSDELHIELEKLDAVTGRRELSQIFLSKKPEFVIGQFNYSNIGYILVGHILEVLSGKSWETLMMERLFTPLAMNSCGFGPTSIEEESPSQPWGHVVQNYTIKAVHNDNAPFYGPSANVHCSIPDWIKFLTVHMNGFNHESNFLKQETFDQLHKLADPLNKNDEYTYGGWFRLQRDWAQGDVLTHTGTNTYNFSSAWIAPKTKTILVSTANRGHYSGSWATSDALTTMIRLFIVNKF
jgi:D-alanyl-D-alanine carboxypeptidase